MVIKISIVILYVKFTKYNIAVIKISVSIHHVKFTKCNMAVIEISFCIRLRKVYVINT